MPFKKGASGNPKGKRPGTPNKATLASRDAFAQLMDGNVQKIQGWLDQIESKDGPRAAFDCLMSMAEFAVPKLARTELTADGSGLKKLVIEWQDPQ